MLVNEWAWLRLQVWLLRLEVELGSVLESELRLKWCVKGMYRLKVVSNENNLGFMVSLKCQRCAMHIYTIIMHNRPRSQDNGLV